MSTRGSSGRAANGISDPRKKKAMKTGASNRNIPT